MEFVDRRFVQLVCISLKPRAGKHICRFTWNTMVSRTSGSRDYGFTNSLIDERLPMHLVNLLIT